MNREKTIAVRVNDKERKTAKEQAKKMGVKLSEWARKKLFGDGEK